MKALLKLTILYVPVAYSVFYWERNNYCMYLIIFIILVQYFKFISGHFLLQITPYWYLHILWSIHLWYWDIVMSVKGMFIVTKQIKSGIWTSSIMPNVILLQAYFEQEVFRVINVKIRQTTSRIRPCNY